MTTNQKHGQDGPPEANLKAPARAQRGGAGGGKDDPERATSPEAHSVPFGSNAVRLRPREWIAALTAIIALLIAIPPAWEQIEPLRTCPDYRVPYPLSNDYWFIRRWFRRAAAEKATLVVGDSVVWGHYVSSRETLSHWLNQLAVGQQFRNLGVDGIHPAALAGLIRYYGKDIAGRNILLNLNLLWMSSRQHDLQTEKEFAFNHPSLVPQFFPRVPCYRESFSRRIGIVVSRYVPYLAWIDHLQIAYFENTDLPSWTVENPYASPLGAVTLRLPSPDCPPSPRPVARPWYEQGIARLDAQWVPLAESFQWRCFRETVDLLRRRGNRLFVLVGPFNEPMLTPSSLRRYRSRLREAARWLAEEHIAHAIPPALPSGQYADASHPLADGYRALASWLLQQPAFRRFIERSP